jgi:outer membrane usher protein FimD/PapC
MMRALNGWQRLWIVASVVLGIGMTVLTVGLMTTREELQDTHDQKMASYTAKLNNLEHPETKAPSGLLYEYYTRDYRTVDEVKSAIRHERDDYEQSLASLPWRQAGQLGFMVLVWIGCSLVLYGVGLTIRWVIRGFRPNRNGPA